MDLYHIWCNLKPGVSDLEFAESVGGYLGELQREERIAAFRVTRRKHIAKCITRIVHRCR